TNNYMLAVGISLCWMLSADSSARRSEWILTLLKSAFILDSKKLRSFWFSSLPPEGLSKLLFKDGTGFIGVDRPAVWIALLGSLGSLCLRWTATSTGRKKRRDWLAALCLSGCFSTDSCTSVRILKGMLGRLA